LSSNIELETSSALLKISLRISFRTKDFSWGAMSLIMFMRIWIIYFSLLQISFVGQKQFGLEKTLGLKKFWTQKFGLEKNFSLKNFLV
jgi:hypothetical protein